MALNVLASSVTVGMAWEHFGIKSRGILEFGGLKYIQKSHCLNIWILALFDFSFTLRALNSMTLKTFWNKTVRIYLLSILNLAQYVFITVDQTYWIGCGKHSRWCSKWRSSLLMCLILEKCQTAWSFYWHVYKSLLSYKTNSAELSEEQDI